MLKKTKDNLEFVSRLSEQLRSEELSVIDFDQLQDQLKQLGRYLSEVGSFEEELDTLRADYQQRMAGMIKAIAVARRSDGSLEQALDQIETLASLSAADLVKNYKRVTSAFRDTFPASYSIPTRKANVVELSTFK